MFWNRNKILEPPMRIPSYDDVKNSILLKWYIGVLTSILIVVQLLVIVALMNHKLFIQIIVL